MTFKQYAQIILLIVAVLLSSCGNERAGVRQKNIAVVYSFGMQDRVHSSIDELIPDLFEDAGVDANICSHYLSSQIAENKLSSSIRNFVDTVFGGNADIVMLYGDRALNSFIEHPEIIKNCPVVFAGVNFPNEVSIRRIPNLYGYCDIPDYAENVRFIHNLRGKTKILVLTSDYATNKYGIQEVYTQARQNNIDTEQIYSNDSFPLTFDMYLKQRQALDRSKHDYSYIRLIPFANVEGLALVQVIRNSSNDSNIVFMQVDTDIAAFSFLSLSRIPILNVLYYGFQSNMQMCGGYFASKETIAADWVGLATQLLSGVSPSNKIENSKKRYYIDYNVLNKLSVDVSSLPSESVIVGQSWTERHKTLTLLLKFSFVFVVIVLIYILVQSRIKIHSIKKANKSIAEEHQFLLNSISSSDAICGKVQDGYIYLTAKYTNVDVGKLKPKMSLQEFLNYIHPDDRERFVKNFSHISERNRFSSQYRCDVYLNKHYVWYEVTYSVIKNSNGSWVAAGVFHNIQSIVDDEQILVRNREIIEKTELKQAFLENMTHEIRSPLNSIVGFSNLLSSPDAAMLSKEDKQNFKNLMGDNISNLLSLLDEILELSHLQTGEMVFNNKSYPVSKLTKDVYLSFQVIINPGLNLIFESSDVDMIVQVDKLRFTQVLMNFLTNSNKFTSHGHILIGSSYDSERNEARIYVSDTGKGMSPDKIDTIFDRFAKADEKDKGTGIGLSLCSIIAKRLGGRIEVVSELGKGSTFTFVLPCRTGF